MVRYALLCILALGLTGCESTAPTQADVAVATVQVAAATDTATALGSSVQFSALVKDAGGNMLSGKTVTWSSTTPAVAVVNAGTGMATAMANGWTSIAASVEGVTGARTLTVAQSVATVVVTPATFSVPAGTTRQFSATALDANGSGVAGIKFLWVSSNTNVAVVDTTGLAHGVGRGEAIIAAAARGQPGYAVLTVTVPAGRLVVASTLDNAVYLYDPVTLTRLSTFTVTAPLSAAVGPDGRVYAGTTSGQIAAINPTTGDIATLGSGIIAGPIYGTDGERERRDLRIGIQHARGPHDGSDGRGARQHHVAQRDESPRVHAGTGWEFLPRDVGRGAGATLGRRLRIRHGCLGAAGSTMRSASRRGRTATSS